MGGDVAVALAGIDRRVARVAAVGSTPDWTRPGMRDLRDASKVVDQGEADPYARWYAEHLDPMRHVERYRNGAAITFELGEADRHIPKENAEAFVDVLRAMETASPRNLRVRTYPGLDHLGVARSGAALDAAADWILAT
jgi:hypothetical protein